VTSSRAVVPALMLAVLLALSGCGVPSNGEPTVIAASDVPYGLVAPTPTEPSSPSMETTVAETGIYLVSPEDVLVPRGRELPGGSMQEQLQELLGELAAGPSRQELAEELSTALPPEIELAVSEVDDDGLATVDLGGLVEAPTGEESRLAVAQIVLTATSLPGVTAVRLTRAGEPIDAPLPGGELTSSPLTAAAFASVLTPPLLPTTPATETPPGGAPPGGTQPSGAPPDGAPPAPTAAPPS
jgi:hypothetical protein